MNAPDTTIIAPRECVDIVFDIETNGFNATVVHCIAVILTATGEEFQFADHHGYDGSIRDGVALLQVADTLIGHNILSFDLRILSKLTKATFDRSRVYDTLIASRLLYPDLLDDDAQAAKIPVSYYGKHSLASWGRRLDCHKGDFSDWYTWSPAMLSYCIQDTRTAWRLYQHIVAATERL